MDDMRRVYVLPTPAKSAHDVKNYKQIQLPNGLKALLVSDTSYDLKELENAENGINPSKKGLKKSAAALCIGKLFIIASYIPYEPLS